MKKKIFTSLLLIVAVVITILTYQSILENRKVPKLFIKEDILYEYKEDLAELKVEDLLLEDSIYDLVSFNVIEDCNESEALISSDEVGEFVGIIFAKLNKNCLAFEYEYKVEDTQFPILENIENLEVEEGSKVSFDQFKAYDVVDGDLEVSIVGDYDLNTPNTYNLEAVAIDKHDNKTTKKFTLTVNKKKVAIIPPATPTVKPPTNVKLTIINGILLVNKKHPLPSNYNPGEDSVAGSQIRKMIADMQNLGFNISSGYSGFRSYSYQKSLFDRYVAMDGVAKAETYSARPGYSEHQTGLTFDLKHKSGYLVTNEPEVSWIKNNAANYGFIVRYPADKVSITGYQYEPWHLRYIGSEAKYIMDNNLSLEEYLNAPGGDYHR